MRTTTQATKRRIERLGVKPTKPAWLKLAIYDALHGHPMSLARERRMCAALFIEQPPRRQYWRPCLSKELEKALWWAGTKDVEEALWKLVVETDEENERD